MTERRSKICIIALALVVGLSSVSAAENDKPTSNEIAKELANPNTVLTSLTLQNLWSIGFSSIFPTAFKEELGSGVFALGPGFQLGRIREKTIFGVFANHVWDIAGESKSSPDLPYLRRSGVAVNLTAIQLFGVILPGGALKVGTTPTITYNHESDIWTAPLHLVVGKTFIISERPWEFSLEPPSSPRTASWCDEMIANFVSSRFVSSAPPYF
jgi:hypothetical protein